MARTARAHGPTGASSASTAIQIHRAGPVLALLWSPPPARRRLCPARTRNEIATDAYPNADDLARLATAHETLDAHGVARGRDGYGVSSLAAAVYARGWSYAIDLGSGGFQAEVRPPGTGLGQLNAVGVGWAPESALAFALVRALQSVARPLKTA